MALKKNIVLISYIYDLSSGVGAKRWNNIVNHLLNDEGVNIHLVSCDKTNDPRFASVHRIPSKYPEILNQVPLSLFQKIRYRLALKKQYKINKGTPYDKGESVGEELKAKLVEVHKTYSLDSVIVSGAPFSWVYFANEVFSEFSDVKVLSDLRDPWTQGGAYGFANLSEERKEIEYKRESLVFEKSKFVSMPSKEMIRRYVNKYPNYQDKIIFLPHGFDADKIDRSLETCVKESVVKKKFIYAGTIYNGTEKDYIDFIRIVKNQSFSSEFQFYVKPGIDLPDDCLKISSVQGYIDEIKLFKEIKKADYFIMCYSERVKDFLSAKLYEILYIGTPIIYIGSKGMISDFIEENKLGLFLDSSKKDEWKLDFDHMHFQYFTEINNYKFFNLAEQTRKMIE